MAAKLILAPEAELDITNAYDWYESRRPGLGEDYLGCVEACLEALRRVPETFNKVHEDYRRFLLRRFPYAIFYEESDDTITIYGVMHTSRNPTQWRQRLG